MCLLVKVAPNTDFPFNWFADCYDVNPDGLGISFVADGEVVVRKALLNSAFEAMQWWEENAPKDTEYAMHWRMRTHGAVDLARVHPYPVLPGLHLMHNGILDMGKADTSVKSDTEIYAETYGRALGPVVHEPLVQNLIGQQIGNNNRFIFISAEHGLIVINERTGVTAEKFPGCWFSNTYAWTPSAWGVPGYHARQIDWSHAFDPRADDFDPNIETHSDYVRWLERNARYASQGKSAEGAPWGKSVVPTVNPDDPEESPEMADDQNVVYWVGKLYDLARASKDQDAKRFLDVYDDEGEFMAVLPMFYRGAKEAASDLQCGVQYLESGTSDFDDVLGWYTLDDDDEPAFEGQEEEDYIHEVRSINKLN